MVCLSKETYLAELASCGVRAGVQWAKVFDRAKNIYAALTDRGRGHRAAAWPVPP